MSNRINWKNLAEDAEKYQGSGTSGDFGSTNYLKMSEGVHRLRIIPAGNDEDELPYKRFIRHEIQVTTAEGKRTHFFLCLNYVKDRENKVSIADPLAQSQRLVAGDVKLIKQFGCPACGAMDAMIAAGNVPKETFLRLRPSPKFIWNVINRADGAIYVWNTSMTLGGSILAMIKEMVEEKINPLDVRRGYDFQIRATGNGLVRRYKDGMFLPVPKPLLKNGDPDSIQPYNLTEVVCGQFKTYQDIADIINEGYSSTLARIGYEIPGDTNNWNRDERDDDDEDEITFAKSPKKISKRETTSDNIFDEMVPPSDEDEEEEIFNRRKADKAKERKKKQEALSIKSKKKSKPVVEEVEDDDDDDAFDWDD